MYHVEYYVTKHDTSTMEHSPVIKGTVDMLVYHQNIIPNGKTLKSKYLW